MSERLDDDYTLTPSGSLGGKTSVGNGKFLGEFNTTEEALTFVRQDMEDNQYYPSIWWISDHGNEWEIDLEGNEIK